MNLVIFATAANLGEIGAFVSEAAKRQTEPVNGCLCVVHDQSISNATISALVEPMARVFASRTAVPAIINNLLSADGQLSTLFAKFYLKAYTQYPGPWLVVDGFAIPLADQFMQLLERQHATYGGQVTGRAVIGDGSVVPVGPIVLNVQAREIKFLSYATTESWRMRGQFYFGRLGFGQVPVGEYLFSVSNKASGMVPAKPEPPPAIAEAVRKEPARQPDTDLGVVNPSLVGRNGPSVADTKVDLEFLMQGMEPMGPINAAITHPAPVASPQLLTMADFANKKALLAEVHRVTGSKPHHFTGNDKLLELLNTAPTP